MAGIFEVACLGCCGIVQGVAGDAQGLVCKEFIGSRLPESTGPVGVLVPLLMAKQNLNHKP